VVDVVPCDALIVRGSCVANEAMLTGESVPQIKESLALADLDELSSGIGLEMSTKGSGGFVDLGSDNSVDANWRRHLVFGGTNILQHSDCTGGEVEEPSLERIDEFKPTESSDFAITSRGALDSLPNPPDKGLIALVVRTAFGTSQGGLMRKILFATERVNANSTETFYFIGVLIVFAVIASAAVLHEGLLDENRNKFRLSLHCIMILTSVVPPELPMELSLAVTNSLAALSKGLVFCTEPFRIPFAGKLDVLCFDKTGTLTMDKMVLKGVVGSLESSGEVGCVSLSALFSTDITDSTSVEIDERTQSRIITSITDPLSPSCSDITRSIMAACHSLLVTLETGAILGDPLEIATMECSGYQFVSEEALNASTAQQIGSSGSLSCVIHPTKGVALKIKHRYPFSSSLKRMSSIVECSLLAESKSGLFIFTKGAPEVLAGHLSVIPMFYHDTYLYHMAKGKRVLTLAYKLISSSCSLSLDLQTLRECPRSQIETGLTFAGFLVFDCDLKADSKSVIRELRSSNHRVIMITGDSAYTAADVASKLGMTKAAASDSALLILQEMNHTTKSLAGANLGAARLFGLVWCKAGAIGNSAKGKSVSTGDENYLTFDPSSDALKQLAQHYSLCVTGPALNFLMNDSSKACVSTKIGFSNPRESEGVLLQALCPHVTIFARVSPAQKETIVLALNDSGLFTLMCGDGTNDVGALKAAHVGVSIVNNPEFERRIEEARDPSISTTLGGKKAKGTNAKERMARAMAEVYAQDIDPTIVKLGDASIASPFTARRTSVDCVLTVLRQGRCTLVTTIQVFKVLALNCLVSAYMMSALYLRGLKQGDMQMTFSGLITAGLFFFLSQAKPLQNLSSAKPPSSVFCKSVAISVLGQFIVHLSCLVATLTLCESFITAEDPTMSADGKFQPNVVNSAIFMLSAVMQVAIM
jgi:cation-transporting ATPase 13A1